MKTIINFVKKETVLVVAWILALISMFLITPDKKYIDYIDFKSLAILWGLMVVVAGLSKNGLFEYIAQLLLSKTKRIWQLNLVLILLPFILSMLITNDVALLTFVPFSIYILIGIDKKDMLIPVITFQTVAANLGSMMTPIGNPQNLYLYGLSDMKVGEFILLMLPYTMLALVLLVIGVFVQKGKLDVIPKGIIDKISKNSDKEKGSTLYTILYGILFVIAVLSVAFPKIIVYQMVVVLVLITVFIIDKKSLLKVDYALLFTFIGFFIFTGNLGRLNWFSKAIKIVVKGHEVLAGIISSQFISNVPAALLLSGFTSNIPKLIVGVNIGGLGTLIASMASLISYKLLAHNYNELKGKYLIYFSIVNIIFLVSLLVLIAII